MKLSMEQEDAFTVLLTGRSDVRYADLVQTMVSSKGLKFDMICCKPREGPDGQPFASTIAYKQALMESLMRTYFQADEIRIYEDRTRQYFISSSSFLPLFAKYPKLADPSFAASRNSAPS